MATKTTPLPNVNVEISKITFIPRATGKTYENWRGMFSIHTNLGEIKGFQLRKRTDNGDIEVSAPLNRIDRGEGNRPNWERPLDQFGEWIVSIINTKLKPFSKQMLEARRGSGGAGVMHFTLDGDKVELSVQGGDTQPGSFGSEDTEE